jgi:hypothetical protein
LRGSAVKLMCSRWAARVARVVLAAAGIEVPQQCDKAAYLTCSKDVRFRDGRWISRSVGQACECSSGADSATSRLGWYAY